MTARAIASSVSLASSEDEVLVKLPLSHVLSADFCQFWTQIRVQ